MSANSGNHAKLQSSLASPPESAWAGVVFNNGSTGTLSYGEIRNAEVGVTSLDPAALTVTNSLFESNETLDLNAKRGTGASLTVQNNTINVGVGTGIQFESTNAGGLNYINGNTVNLSSLSDKGIALIGKGPLREIYDNTFSGGATAYAIEVTGEGDWLLEHNTFTSCSVGIREDRNSQQADLTGTIGGNGVGDRNTITYCTTGISLDGSNVKPKIRYNDINQNTTGIVIRTNAVPDIGTDTTGNVRGKNTFLSNTTYCINHLTSGTIQAIGNYFGDIAGCDPNWVPSCANGSINFGKSLCTDPGGALLEMVALSGLPLVVQGVFPNPIQSAGVIRFSIAKSADVTVRIYDLSGRMIRNLEASQLGVGAHDTVWNGKDDKGQDVSSGLYFVRVTSGANLEKTAKLLVAR